MKKIEPHDGLEVGTVSDDNQASFNLEHGCYCNCGEPNCFVRVWRQGHPRKCAVCHARGRYEGPSLTPPAPPA